MNRIWTPLLFLISVLVTASTANADFTTGLEAYWAFDNNLTDSSGKGHTLANEGTTNVSYISGSAGLTGDFSVFFDSTS